MSRRFLGIAVALSYLLGAAVVHANCPTFIPIVGLVNNGSAPDPVGLVTLAVDPITAVTVDFTGCCDINLCGVVITEGTGQMECPGVITGTSALNGNFSFYALGAAKDPGNLIPPAGYGGCGADGIVVSSTISAVLKVCMATAFCLDQNGAAGQSNGTTVSDISNVLNLLGKVGLTGTYWGRGDIDQNEAITIGDVAALIGHFGRLQLIQGVGCGSLTHCVKPACP